MVQKHQVSARGGRIIKIQTRCILTLISVGLTAPLQAQDRIDLTTHDYSQYRLEAVKVGAGPQIDGRLDDKVWSQAPVATGFTQFSPDYLAPATERTEVRVLYDDLNLYIGATVYDSDPKRVIGRETRRDARTWNTDDTFDVSVSPFPDMSNVYFFSTTPLGQQRDSFVGNFGENTNSSWDGIWWVKATQHDQGWSAEIAIPFKTFRFPKSAIQTWGINFRRAIRRKRESAYWRPVSRADGFAGMYKLENGGRLVGLEGVKPGRALEILPYTVLGSLGNRSVASTLTTPTPSHTHMQFEAERNVGGDVKWGISPNITLDASVNPDFATIESDQEVVNLSRFEFRFEEKRPFFLEGADLFQFGQPVNYSSGSALPLFFSRRIGAQNFDGTDTPIDLAVKVTGKSGRTSFAYFNAQTGAVSGAGVSKTNWQVFRLRQDLARESRIGVMALFKEPGESFAGFSNSAYNRVVGLDGFFRLGKTNHRMEVLVAKSWLPSNDSRVQHLAASTQAAGTWAGSVSHRWRNDYFNTAATYKDIREGFYADMGFVRRRDIRQIRANAENKILLRRYGIREIENKVDFEYTDNHEGSFLSDRLSWKIEFRPKIELENGLSFFGGWHREFDTLSALRRIAGVHFPPAAYAFGRISAGAETNPGNPVVFKAEYAQGTFYDGDLLNLQAEITVKPIPRLLLNLELENNRLNRSVTTARIAATDYRRDNTFIGRFRMNYSFTPEFYISTFVQANRSWKKAQNEQRGANTTLVSNLLIAYRMQSGHSFFIAYNQLADDDYSVLNMNALDRNRPFRIAGAAVVAKFQYLFNI